MTTVCVKYDEKVYPREAVLKAAYSYLNSTYIHLAHEEDHIVVTFTAKDESELPENIEKEFENELLAQTIRLHVYNETHEIREILMARAMSSSMIYKKDPIGLFEEKADEDEIDSILEDWFKSGAE